MKKVYYLEWDFHLGWCSGVGRWGEEDTEWWPMCEIKCDFFKWDMEVICIVFF